MKRCQRCNTEIRTKHYSGYCSQECRRLDSRGRHASETPEQRAARIQRIQQQVREGSYDEQTAAEHAAEAIIDAIEN